LKKNVLNLKGFFSNNVKDIIIIKNQRSQQKNNWFQNLKVQIIYKKVLLLLLKKDDG